MIEVIILTVIVIVAVWYLFSRFMAALRTENSACGCGSCENCPAARNDKSDSRESDA
ncbi:MAG: FeoB-associated Cys-rich membrane protein [Desulfosalsimonas sp.]